MSGVLHCVASLPSVSSARGSLYLHGDQSSVVNALLENSFGEETFRAFIGGRRLRSIPTDIAAHIVDTVEMTPSKFFRMEWLSKVVFSAGCVRTAAQRVSVYRVGTPGSRTISAVVHTHLSVSKGTPEADAHKLYLPWGNFVGLCSDRVLDKIWVGPLTTASGDLQQDPERLFVRDVLRDGAVCSEKQSLPPQLTGGDLLTERSAQIFVGVPKKFHTKLQMRGHSTQSTEVFVATPIGWLSAFIRPVDLHSILVQGEPNSLQKLFDQSSLSMRGSRLPKTEYRWDSKRFLAELSRKVLKTKMGDREL